MVSSVWYRLISGLDPPRPFREKLDGVKTGEMSNAGVPDAGGLMGDDNDQAQKPENTAARAEYAVVNQCLDAAGWASDRDTGSGANLHPIQLGTTGKLTSGQVDYRLNRA